MLVVAVGVLVVTTVIAVVGAFKAGVSTDEPVHVMRLKNFLDTGWYALDWDYLGRGPAGDGTNTFVYAPVTMLLLHAWSVLWGVEGWGDVSTTSHAYDVRHLGVVLISLVGLAAVAALGRVLMRSWGWGVVAAAVLAALPEWTGYAMVNVKDIPVATGYTLVTLGCAAMVRSKTPGLRLSAARCAVLVAGLVLTQGTRPGMWSGLFATLVATLVAIGISSAKRAVALRSIAEILASCVLAAGLLIAIYPKLFASPIEALPRTAEGSASFISGITSDRLYVPRHVAEEIPTLLLVCVLVGSAVGIARFWSALRSRAVIGGWVASGRVAVVGVQAFVLPVAAMILGSYLYHGLRQLLFALPAMAVLATYGMVWLRERYRGRRLMPVLMAAALVMPVVDQALLFPYEATYVNLATDVVVRPFSTVSQGPGGDFWRLSIPELIDGVDIDGQLLCKATTNRDGTTAFRFTSNHESYSTTRSTDCREEANGPLAPQGLAVRREIPPDEFYAIFLKKVPGNCTQIKELDRWRHGEEIPLTVIGLCKDTPPVLNRRGVDTSTALLGSGTPHDLWRFASDGWEQWPNRDVLTAPVTLARIGLRPDPKECAAGCAVNIIGEMPDDLRVAVDGQPVTASTVSRGVQVPISAEQATGSGSGVWITLTRASGRKLDATMTALRLVKGKTS